MSVLKNVAGIPGRAVWFMRRMLKPGAPNRCKVQNTEFIVAKGVFNPSFSRATEFIANHIVPMVRDKRVLEVGTGCGAIGILCALNGAKIVVCTDISKKAVACAQKNVQLHRVSSICKILERPDLSRIGTEFDIVFFPLPYVFVEDVRPFQTGFGDLALSMFDEGYQAQKMFFREVRVVLAREGRAFVAFSNTGELDRFFFNAGAENFDLLLIAKEGEGRADNRLYELVDKKH